jgi:prephenate dehydrogenase
MKIAIIGYGRFGRLFADIIKPCGEIFAMTEQPLEDGVSRVVLEGLSDMDMVIPAVPISALEAILKKIKPHLKPGVILMDVCSVKVNPCECLLEHGPLDAQLIGSHPMFGPDSTKNGIEGLQMVFTPLRADAAVYEKVKGIFEAMKLKIIETTPEEHDRQAANCLALVHFLGRGFGRMEIRNQEITTLGYDRLLAVNETVNNDTWQLFLDMQEFNPFAGEVRQRLMEELKKLDNEIRSAV